MTDDLRVRADGTPSEPERSTRASTGVMVAAAFVVGLGIGLLIVPQTPDTETVEPGVASPAPVTTLAQPETGGISEVVPGFPDALVALGGDGGSGLQHLLWPVSGPLVARSMDRGDNPVFDVASIFIAHTTSVPGLDGWVLSTGRFTSMRPVVDGVTSFSWHDSRSGSLSYTTEPDGGTRLWVVGAGLNAAEVPIEPEEGLTVAAWGDWGWALQTVDNETLLLNPAGEVRGQIRGLPYASTPTGWILVVTEGYQLVSAGGGVNGMRGRPDIGFLRAAAFSPDGERVALAGSSGVAIMDTTGDGAVETLIRPGSLWVSWSSDSRFLVMSALRGVRIYDLDEETTHIVLQHRNVSVADVIPLSRS